MPRNRINEESATIGRETTLWRIVFLLGFSFLFLPVSARADKVTDWNAIAATVAITNAQRPPAASAIDLAYMHQRGSGSALTELHRGQQSLPELLSSTAVTHHLDNGGRWEYPISSELAAAGIKELILETYKKRYQKWKREFLASETGQRQWETYAHHPHLVLTITVSGDKRDGATTDNFKWDDSGNLIAATITLGCRIDQGNTNPARYPVLSSLEKLVESDAISRHILAAAKIAHEFGHLNRMVNSDGALWRLQSQIAPVYVAILRSNGYNTRDPRLIGLAREMGGTPVELSDDSEYWAEVNAMLYLRDRIAEGRLRRSLFNRIKQNVDLYARGFEERFVQIARSQMPPFPVAVGSSSPDR